MDSAADLRLSMQTSIFIAVFLFANLSIAFGGQTCSSSSDCSFGTLNSCCDGLCSTPWSCKEGSCAAGEDMKYSHAPDSEAAGCAPIEACSMSHDSTGLHNSSQCGTNNCCSTDSTDTEHPFGQCTEGSCTTSCVPGEIAVDGACTNQYICKDSSTCTFGTLNCCCDGLCDTYWSSRCKSSGKTCAPPSKTFARTETG